jgi:hypothetical protein
VTQSRFLRLSQSLWLWWSSEPPLKFRVTMPKRRASVKTFPVTQFVSHKAPLAPKCRSALATVTVTSCAIPIDRRCHTSFDVVVVRIRLGNAQLLACNSENPGIDRLFLIPAVTAPGVLGPHNAEWSDFCDVFSRIEKLIVSP